MSWIGIWVHMIFATKNRFPFFNSKEIRGQVFQHIKDNADEKGIWLDRLNGFEEHIHCLIALQSTQTVQNIARLIKGESSIWINNNQITEEYFAWQKEYFAVSVGINNLNKIRNYIANQENHHQENSFTEEIDEFVKQNDLKRLHT